jgi:hypothetical protein
MRSMVERLLAAAHAPPHHSLFGEWFPFPLLRNREE